MANYRVFTMRTTQSFDDLAAYGTAGEGRELKVTSGRYTYGLNKAGTCTLSIPKKADIDPLRLPHIEPELITIWIQRDSQLVWGGIVWDIESSTDSPTVNLTAEEFPSIFNYVLLDTPLPKTAAGAVQIARSLFNSTRTDHPSLAFPFMGFASWPYGSDGHDYVPQWHRYDDRTIMDLVGELAKVGQYTQPLSQNPSSLTEGFEWTQQIWQGVAHETLDLGNIIVQWDAVAYWSFFIPRAGTEKDFPVIEIGPATRESASKVSWHRSGRDSTRSLRVVGFGSGSQRQEFTDTHTPSWQSGYPWHEQVYSDSDIRTNQQAQAVCRDRLNKIGYPVTTMTAEVPVGSRFPFGSVDVGDRLWTQVHDYDLELPAARLRVTSMGYRWGGGNEVAELDLQPDMHAMEF